MIRLRVIKKVICLIFVKFLVFIFFVYILCGNRTLVLWKTANMVSVKQDVT